MDRLLSSWTRKHANRLVRTRDTDEYRERRAFVRRDFDAPASDRAPRFQDRQQASQARRTRLLGIRRLARARVLGRFFVGDAAGTPAFFFQTRGQILYGGALPGRRFPRVRTGDARFATVPVGRARGLRLANP